MFPIKAPSFPFSAMKFRTKPVAFDPERLVGGPLPTCQAAALRGIKHAEAPILRPLNPVDPMTPAKPISSRIKVAPTVHGRQLD
jgi:hypothetical protein